MPKPYRADHVGSLLRPPELLKARADVAEGKVDHDYLRYEEDRAILDVLSLQREIGVGGLATQNTIAVKMLLDKAGVDLASVSFAEVPFTAMVNAIKAGHIDAVVPVDPFTTQLRLSGGRVLSWNYVESIPKQPPGVWFTKAAFARSNPQVIEGFIRSMKESIDYLRADEQDQSADFHAQ